MGHSKTPWIFDKYGTVLSNGHTVIISGFGLSYGPRNYEAKYNARRIVACVNACKGLSTDELERFGLASAFGTEMLEIEKQRDRLAEVLRNLVTDLECLMAESGGVIGFHLNGDIAPWDELKKDGSFECLGSLHDATAALAAVKGE